MVNGYASLGDDYRPEKISNFCYSVALGTFSAKSFVKPNKTQTLRSEIETRAKLLYTHQNLITMEMIEKGAIY